MSQLNKIALGFFVLACAFGGACSSRPDREYVFEYPVDGGIDTNTGGSDVGTGGGRPTGGGPGTGGVGVGGAETGGFGGTPTDCDTCIWALDDVCDETTNICEPGTDCTDCRNGCTDSCAFANNGACDEVTGECVVGTDCSDCEGVCAPDDSGCVQNDDCCGYATDASLCVDFLSGVTQCAAYCTTNAECASGCCILLTSGEGACGPSSECSLECRAIGETCDTDNECCDGICTDDGIGPKTCGAPCNVDTDCQSSCCVRRNEDGLQACFAPEFCGDCGPSGCACENDCMYANDGACDDGSLGSTTALCRPGSDCADCGPHELDGVSFLCDDSCGNTNGSCEDGAGPGALASLCAVGTDCSDCGPRGTICLESCADVLSNGNGICEDNGEVCAYGGDCTDCGPRTSPSCEDTCYFNSDGVCDDSGPLAEYPDCGYGTDCTDCGVR